MLWLKRLRDLWSVFAVAYLFLVAGCTAVGSTETSLIMPVTSEPDPLSGTRWQLIAFEDRENPLNIPEEEQFFIEFEQGSLNFVTGCNNPSGHYLLEGNQITVTFAKTTTMDCADSLGPDAMAIESAFSAVMPMFESYDIDGARLRIRYGQGEMIFIKSREP